MRIDISNDIFSLPSIKDKSTYFPDYVDDYLKKYRKFLGNINICKEIINDIEKFSKYIYMCLIDYYNGQHSNAKELLNLAINSICIESLYEPLDERIFYRVRKSTLKSSDMFHIPYEKRHLVSTQRYSYPGYPCLYMGSSVDVCCDELRSRNENLKVACIKRNTIIAARILNLYFFQKYDFNNLTNESKIKFLKFWPLVACCSFNYSKTNKMNFRPDYIIPQLLLEYLMDQNSEVDILGEGIKVYGIRYHSVLGSLFDENKSPTYVNYVFPTIISNRTGHCDFLSNLFIIESVSSLKDLQKK